MAARTYKSKYWWKRQLEEQLDSCAYCERPLHDLFVTIEHIIPRSWGGPGKVDFNLIVVCGPCQRQKSAWECLTVNRCISEDGFSRCEELILLVDRLAAKPGTLMRYGKRSPLFINIPRLVRQAMENSYWEERPPEHKRVLFLGERLQEVSNG